MLLFFEVSKEFVYVFFFLNIGIYLSHPTKQTSITPQCLTVRLSDYWPFLRSLVCLSVRRSSLLVHNLPPTTSIAYVFGKVVSTLPHTNEGTNTRYNDTLFCDANDKHHNDERNINVVDDDNDDHHRVSLLGIWSCSAHSLLFVVGAHWIVIMIVFLVLR